MLDNDPLYRMRHALAGLALALVVSVPMAAWLGALVADRIADRYGLRVGLYAALLVYVVVGTVRLFLRVAQHETRPLTLARLLRWIASLWLWPVLLRGR